MNLELYTTVYLSPHFDDVALSCGGWAAAEAAAGRRGLCITVFAAPPPAQAALSPYAQLLHDRWGEGGGQAGNRMRRAEDAAALAHLGLAPVWLDFGDAPYRSPRYDSDPAIFGPLLPEEQETLPAVVAEAVQATLTAHGVAPGTPLYVPLGAGNHVDHQAVFLAGLRFWQAGRPVWFYEDYPYAARPGQLAPRLAALAAAVAPGVPRPVVRDVAATLDARIAAILAYPSQISSLFPSAAAVPNMVRAYAAEAGATHGLAAAERYWTVNSER
jgi:LmbE family N-acetylglucosaminyl deacetylase